MYNGCFPLKTFISCDFSHEIFKNLQFSGIFPWNPPFLDDFAIKTSMSRGFRPPWPPPCRSAPWPPAPALRRAAPCRGCAGRRPWREPRSEASAMGARGHDSDGDLLQIYMCLRERYFCLREREREIYIYINRIGCYNIHIYIYIYLSLSLCVWNVWTDVKLRFTFHHIYIYISRGSPGSPGSRGGRWPTKTPPRGPWKRTGGAMVVHLGAFKSQLVATIVPYIYIYILYIFIYIYRHFLVSLGSRTSLVMHVRDSVPNRSNEGSILI